MDWYLVHMLLLPIYTSSEILMCSDTPPDWEKTRKFLFENIHKIFELKRKKDDALDILQGLKKMFF